jgi:hypothetical protein
VWPVLRPQRACFTTAANDGRRRVLTLVVVAVHHVRDGTARSGRSLAEARGTAIEPLQRLGYIFWAENPKTDRMFFVKGMPRYRYAVSFLGAVSSEGQREQILVTKSLLLIHSVLTRKRTLRRTLKELTEVGENTGASARNGEKRIATSRGRSAIHARLSGRNAMLGCGTNLIQY